MILFLKLQILAGISATTVQSYAEINHRLIFTHLSSDIWRQDFVKEVVQIKYPKFWTKWIDKKTAQLKKLGERSKQTYERCGQELK